MSDYIKTNWQDGENKYAIKDQADNIIHDDIKLVYKGTGGTPLSSANMNKIEQGIYESQLAQGNCQSDFGLNGAVLKNCAWNESHSAIDLNNARTISCETEGSLMTVYGNNGYGERYDNYFTANINRIYSVDLKITKYGTAPSFLIVSIYNETSSTLLAQKNIPEAEVPSSGWLRVTFDNPIEINPGNIIQLRVDANGIGDSSNRYGLYYNNASFSENIPNAYAITTTNLWVSRSSASQDILHRLNVGYEVTSGVVEKTVGVKKGIEKWGSVAHDIDISENTSLTLDIVDGDEANIADYRDLDGNLYYWDVYTTTFISGKFKALKNSASTVKVGFICQRYNSPASPLQVHVYTSVNGFPGVSLGSTEIQTTMISDIDTYLEADITLSQQLVSGTDYFVLFKTNAGDSNNKFKFHTRQSMTAIVGTLYTSSNSGSSWSHYDSWGCYFCVHSDTLIKSNVATDTDLSDIDSSLYPILKFKYTLQRDQLSTESPKLIANHVTWKGKSNAEWELIAEINETYPTYNSMPTVVQFNDRDTPFTDLYDDLYIEAKDVIINGSDVRIRCNFNSNQNSNCYHSYVAGYGLSSYNILNTEYFDIGRQYDSQPVAFRCYIRNIKGLRKYINGEILDSQNTPNALPLFYQGFTTLSSYIRKIAIYLYQGSSTPTFRQVNIKLFGKRNRWKY